MGYFEDKTYNVVSELLRIIPSSFLVSKEFEEGLKEKEFYNKWHIIHTSVSLKNVLDNNTTKAKVTLDKVCQDFGRDSIRIFYEFISFVIECYCKNNNVKVSLSGLKRELKTMGIVRFDNIEDWDNSKSNSVAPQKEPVVIKQEKFEQTNKDKNINMNDNTQRKRNVFVVHGHDELLKTKVENVLLKLGLNPIILSQMPNEGDTIIDKFEKNSSKANYVIVLLTADDEGKAISDDSYNLRARQNVIFERGYFRAKLGKQNLCYLYEEEKKVELPSDIEGIGYVPVTRGDQWRFNLVEELQNCGFDVSADDLIKKN